MKCYEKRTKSERKLCNCDARRAEMIDYGVLTSKEYFETFLYNVFPNVIHVFRQFLDEMTKIKCVGRHFI